MVLISNRALNIITVHIPIPVHKLGLFHNGTNYSTANWFSTREQTFGIDHWSIKFLLVLPRKNKRGQPCTSESL